MLILTLCAGIFYSETGVVKAASDSQVVEGMTIEDGVVVSYEGTAEHVVIPDGVTVSGFLLLKNRKRCVCQLLGTGGDKYTEGSNQHRGRDFLR